MKTIMKIIMVVIMIVGIIISIINLSAPKSQAKSVFGTWREMVIQWPVTIKIYLCTGEATNCVDVFPDE
jgi:carbon starvation protein CstA